MNRNRIELGRCLALALIFALTMMGDPMPQAQAQSAPAALLERTVTVSGVGHVTAEPDIAHITLGVVSEADTAKAALDKNSTAMNGIVTALKAGGVAPKDLQTSNFSVNPRYRQPTTSGAPATINGYQVQNTLRIVVRDIASLGTILDQVIQLGSNQVHGVGFEVSRAEEIRDEARKAAVANARHKGALFATAAGARLGRVLAIEEGGIAPVHRQPQAMARGAAMMAAAPPIEAGTQRLDAHVTVTFALE